MTRAELAKILAKKANLKEVDAYKLIDAFGQTIADVLAIGGKVVYSNFGSFYTVHYPSKVIYHPVLGIKKKMVMLPTDAVKWMPSENIKEMVNLGRQVESATSFGAAKELMEAKKAEGLPMSKAIELDEPITSKPNEAPATSEPLEEEIEIPIKISRKNTEEEKAKEPSIWEAASQKDSPDLEAQSNTASEPSDEPKGKVSLIGEGIFTPGAPKAEASAPEPQKSEIPATDQNDSALGEPIKVETFKPTEPAINTPRITEEPISDLDKATPQEEAAELTPFHRYKSDISYVELSKTTVPKEILALIPEKIARENKVVPIEINDNILTVAMVDPEDIETIETIKRLTQKKISAKLTTEDDLNHVLSQYQGFESEVKEAIDDVVDTKEAAAESDQADPASADAPAARIVSSLLKRAYRDKASDIHIEPLEGEVAVRFRIDGILHKKVTLPKDIKNAVASRIKIMANLKIDEQRLPQDGRFSLKVDNQKIDFRVSTMPVANGEKIVMRVLDKVAGVITIDKLGFRERDSHALDEACSKSHGMILVTGPTGSGKTTTLYAMIDKIYAEGINIVTLEDPIEYQMPGINQSQVNPEIDYTFASGLRSILRQDPDVVMIGEIRDKETAEMAVHAALTGHVVLSTLHTNDSAGAILRMVDMGVEPFLINSSLNLVIGQRLARKICDSCKEDFTLDGKVLDEVKKEFAKMPEKERAGLDVNKLKFFHGKGCKDCDNTGYRGRIGVYELLVVNNEVKGLAAKHSDSGPIKEAAIRDGMTTMIQDGILKALMGQTTIEEIWRVTKE